MKHGREKRTKEGNKKRGVGRKKGRDKKEEK
jgi:hypothetical protein